MLLHCILSYPTDNANAHLRMITGPRLPRPHGGLFDHTMPDDADVRWQPPAGVGGDRKALTHDKTLPGNDHYHAMDVHDLTRFVALVDRIHIAGLSDHKAPIATEAIHA